jgi:hypothetical protein
LNNAMAETELGGFSVNIPVVSQALVVGPTELTVPEGSTAVFTVRLAAQPSADVTVTIARLSGDVDVAVQGGATKVFTVLNWSNPVPVTLAALMDADQQAGSAVFECRSDGLPPVTVLATEQDTTPDGVLTATVNNPAWGTVNPSGGTFAAGSSIQVTAAPSTYFRFVQWTGDYSAANNPLTVVVSTNVTIEAVFNEIVTTNHFTPHGWLAANGYTNDFENAEVLIGANGVPLWQSYIAGLNPNDPGSQFRLTLTASADGTSCLLNWNTVTGRVYTVWSSTSMAEGFAPVPGATNLPWTVQTFTNVNDQASSSVIYRMDVRKP